MKRKSKKLKSYPWRPLVVDWGGLKAMGWPFSEVQTKDPERAERAGYPRFHKLGDHANSRCVWIVRDVLAYFERHGLPVTKDWFAQVASLGGERDEDELVVPREFLDAAE